MAWTTGLTTIGIDASVSAGTSIVGSGTANTKGAWVQLVASTASDSWGMIAQIQYRGTTNLSDDFLIDIGIGGSGSEVVLVGNLLASTNAVRQGLYETFLPIAIPSGTRVSARCQNNSTSTADILGLSIVLFGKGTQSGASACQTYGANTADSGGIVVDAGAAPNTKGAWAQVTAATTADCNWIAVHVGDAGDTSRASANYLLDVGTGGSGSEVVLIPDLSFGVTTLIDTYVLKSFTVPVPTIASGTRLSARLASTTATAGDRTCDVVLYAFNVPQITGGGGGAWAFA